MSVDNKQIERTLIGKLIINPQDYYNNHSLLSPDIFKDPKNKRIYTYLSKELEDGNKVDLVTLSEKISKSGEDLTSDVARMISEDAYLETQALTCILVLNQKKKKEQLLSLNNQIADMLSRDDDLFEILEYVEEQVGKIGNVSKDEIVNVKEQLGGLLKDIEYKMNNEGLNGITTGFNSIDKFTGGWQETDLVIIGGASSMGKTSLALAFAFNSAFIGGSPT